MTDTKYQIEMLILNILCLIILIFENKILLLCYFCLFMQLIVTILELKQND